MSGHMTARLKEQMIRDSRRQGNNKQLAAWCTRRGGLKGQQAGKVMVTFVPSAIMMGYRRIADRGFPLFAIQPPRVPSVSNCFWCRMK